MGNAWLRCLWPSLPLRVNAATRAPGKLRRLCTTSGPAHATVLTVSLFEGFRITTVSVPCDIREMSKRFVLANMAS